MAKFSRAARTARPLGPTRTRGVTRTHEGGIGWEKDPKTALYTLAVTNMVGETTFYESASDRDDRYRQLVHQVATEDPAWVAAFIPWLRNHAHMRSASIVAAIEYAVAKPTVTTDATRPRRVIDSAMARADEPAEALAYWLTNYGRQIPKPVRRGIGDAAARLYTQHAYLKYDSGYGNVRMRDVLNLCHPTKGNHNLYQHILDRTYGRWENTEERRDTLHHMGLNLPTLGYAYTLDAVAPDQRRDILRSLPVQGLTDAGYTWERLSGWLPGGMDAEAWEKIIPSMGYMALLRNLRNFDKAKISKATADAVAARLADPAEVLRSRQFPYRFYSAWRNSGSMTYGPALEAAMDHAMTNVPTLGGSTLVAIDVSGSMEAPISARTAVMRHNVGAVFAASIAAKNPVTTMMYADTGRIVELPSSVLRACEHIEKLIGSVGWGTHTWPSVQKCYRSQDRVVVFTDMQDHPSAAVLPDVPIYVWDLAGYAATNIETGRGRYLFSGFSDASLSVISLLEASQNATWPWEISATAA